MGLDVGLVFPEASTRSSSGRSTRRHHLRHEQRVRLRLPARQHGDVSARSRSSAAALLHRRRDRLDPDRRGPHAADHLGQGAVADALSVASSLDLRAVCSATCHYEVDEEKRTVAPRRGRPCRRASTRSRQPVRPGSANLVHPTPGCAARPRSSTARTATIWSTEAVPCKIVDEFTGRVMEAGAGPMVSTRPSRRRKGWRQGREPDPRHDHLQNYYRLYDARRHDRYRRDRGVGVRRDLRPPRRPGPDQQAVARLTKGT